MTSKEWKKCKLGEIAEFNPSESIKKGQLAKKIAMEKLIPYCKQIPSFERCKYNGGTKFRNGDTIMARITPCLENGKISKVTILNDNEIGFGSTEYIVFRAIENLSNPDFLYYLITSSLVREPAIKSMVGSSGRQRVQIDVVKNIEIGIPPLETQQKIASILSSIDDKIELNNSINNNLEQQAQALFYEIYNNGKCGTIGDILEIIETGSRPKGGALTHGVPSVGAENINGFGVYDYSKDKFISAEFYNKLNRGIVKSKDVLLYKDGAYTGKVSMTLDDFPHKQCAVNEHVFLLRTNKLATQFFLYFCLLDNSNRQKIHTLACGKAAQPGLNQNELKSVPIKIPNMEDIINFDITVTPIMKQIANNAKEKQKLAQLRDTLLPKLMSGEIDVSKV